MLRCRFQQVIGHLLRVLARYLVPFLLARDGYFFCRKACSSRMASATDFLLLMSSWLLHIQTHNKYHEKKTEGFTVLSYFSILVSTVGENAAYLAIGLLPPANMPVFRNL